MSVFEAVSMMISFGILLIALISYLDKSNRK